MSDTESPKPLDSASPHAIPAPANQETGDASWNFAVLAAYQVIMRVGWIFKTESIVMPAVLDLLGGGAWLRGCLPLLNRFGQSVPPLLLSRRIKITRHKKLAMALCAVSMSFCFLLLSWLWVVGAGVASWLPVAFLAVYAVFFMSTGVHQLSFSTLQGKLVEPTRRGRLLLTANVIGATCACGCAWLLLPGWLEEDRGKFEFIFGFTGICFLIAAAGALTLREQPDGFQQQRLSLAQLLGSAWQLLSVDANFRRLAIVAALFGVSLMLFPHYQALARERMGMQLDNLMLWVVVQNAGTALFSFVIGPLADRCGNRISLIVLVLGVCVAPLAAITFPLAGSLGQRLFPLVFLLVGLTPVVIRTLHNYTLEISKPGDHPKYLSTLSLCAAAPACCSPLVGLLVGWLGFEAVFCAVAAIVLFGWLLTFGLLEPRHEQT